MPEPPLVSIPKSKPAMLTPAYFTLPFEEATELVAALLVVEARLAAVVTGALLAAAVVVALMEVAALVVVVADVSSTKDHSP